MGSRGVWRRQSPDKTGGRKRTGCETGRQTYRQTEGDAGKTQVGRLLRQLKKRKRERNGTGWETRQTTKRQRGDRQVDRRER